MNRRDLLCAGVGATAATAAAAAGVLTAERQIAVKLPANAPIGSAVMLVKVASGWIVLQSVKCAGRVET